VFEPRTAHQQNPTITRANTADQRRATPFVPRVSSGPPISASRRTDFEPVGSVVGRSAASRTSGLTFPTPSLLDVIGQQARAHPDTAHSRWDLS
jgi:hypothetical protein